jgi:hypothetical protein
MMQMNQSSIVPPPPVPKFRGPADSAGNLFSALSSVGDSWLRDKHRLLHWLEAARQVERYVAYQATHSWSCDQALLSQEAAVSVPREITGIYSLLTINVAIALNGT